MVSSFWCWEGVGWDADGVCRRSSEQTEVMSFELFFDLLYGEFSASGGEEGGC